MNQPSFKAARAPLGRFPSRLALALAVVLLLLALGVVILLRRAGRAPIPAVSVTVVAAGDIACDPDAPRFVGGNGEADHCRQMATSDLVIALKPDAVLLLGDSQYEGGEFEQFLASYDPSWGRFKDITYPAVGNHEYLTPGAKGYYRYFGRRAGDPTKGYYSFDLGAWHLVVLNSNCTDVGGCMAGKPQETWLRTDLAAHPSTCVLAYWHHPRFSSGEHGSNERYQDFWKILYQANAEVVLGGHDHSYERFAPQDALGHADPERGVRQFVVGTGGKGHRPIGDMQANSEVRHTGDFGVLKLTLHPSSYDWEFVPEAGGTFGDSGSSACH